MLKEYYRLAKPGIVYGNILTTVAGFIFAAGRHINFELFLATVLGTSLVIASACIFNNVIDRDIDRLMERTEGRAIASGRISIISAVVYGTVLGLLGFFLLYHYVNWRVVVIGLIGFIDYVGFYTWSKRKTPYATLIGTVCGAMPIVAGYVAVTNKIDIAAVLLFAIMVIWQMPHFYAIAIYRLKDYQEAKIPVWPSVNGINSTKLQIIGFLILYLLISPLLTIYGGANKVYFVVIGLASVVWLVLGIADFHSKDSAKWAKRLFFTSLIELLVLSGLLVVNLLI